MLNTELDVAFAEMDALARQLFGRPGRGAWRPETTDFTEEDGAFVWRANLPGLSASDVDVELEDGLLQVRAHRGPVAAAEGLTAVHRERPSLRLHRRWRLPDQVDPDGVEAELTDGVFTLRLRKRPDTLPRRITVQG